MDFLSAGRESQKSQEAYTSARLNKMGVWFKFTNFGNLVHSIAPLKSTNHLDIFSILLGDGKDDYFPLKEVGLRAARTSRANAVSKWGKSLMDNPTRDVDTEDVLSKATKATKAKKSI